MGLFKSIKSHNLTKIKTNMDILTTMLINFSLGISGFLFHDLWDSRIYMKTSEGWILSKFINDNYQHWIFYTLIIFFILVLLNNSPESVELIKTMMGIEIDSSIITGSYFVIGYVLPPFLYRTISSQKTTTDK